jgi:FMN phosphatase YigB (HAD superfamily)
MRDVSVQLKSLGYCISPVTLFESYRKAAVAPDLWLNSVFIQALCLSGVSLVHAVALRTKSTWNSYALDIYFDTKANLKHFYTLGYDLWVLGNQEKSTRGVLSDSGCFEWVSPYNVLLSKDVGLKKPDPCFFNLLFSDGDGIMPSNVLYVGDRPDHDITPCHRLGINTARVRRGPFKIQATPPLAPGVLHFDLVDGGSLQDTFT